MNQALNLPPSAEELVVVRISPSFAPDQVLSLVQGRDRRYVLRSTRLTENVWQKMLSEMRAQQGSTITLDDDSQRAALARVVVTKTTRERSVDTRTAELFLELWRSLVARAQVVQEVGGHTGKLDGVRYRIWHKGVGVTTHSPRRGSVLAHAMAGAEHLLRFVEADAENQQAEKASARKEMQNALRRTRREERCLRKYQGGAE